MSLFNQVILKQTLYNILNKKNKVIKYCVGGTHHLDLSIDLACKVRHHRNKTKERNREVSKRFCLYIANLASYQILKVIYVRDMKTCFHNIGNKNS